VPFTLYSPPEYIKTNLLTILRPPLRLYMFRLTQLHIRTVRLRAPIGLHYMKPEEICDERSRQRAVSICNGVNNGW